MPMRNDRRSFLKSTCQLCMLAAAGVLVSELESCSPGAKVLKAPISADGVRIPLASFAGQPVLLVRPEGWLFDLAVKKKPDQTYEALLLQCTHQQNRLAVMADGYVCALHGSRFGPDGQVLKGPAEQPLKHYQTSTDQDQLVIHLKN